MRGRATFRQRDVTAAVKAVAAAGHVVARVEITPDRIVVITAAAGKDDTAKNDVDKWLEKHAHSNEGTSPGPKAAR
jgi:hypothetical protein